MPPVTIYGVLRRRHFEHAMAQLPGHIARMDWSAEQVSAEREMRLHRLLALARLDPHGTGTG
jgi:hypothetical protein